MNQRSLFQSPQIPASRSSQRSESIASAAELGPTTRHALAFAAALLVNVAVLGTLQWTAANARYAPAGEVVITQLESPTPTQLAKN